MMQPEEKQYREMLHLSRMIDDALFKCEVMVQIGDPLALMVMWFPYGILRLCKWLLAAGLRAYENHD